MNDVAAAQADILFAQKSWLGLVTLNRPRVFNALTHDMCRQLDAQLRDWEARAEVALVVITGSGDRAFCAGGDVKSVWAAGPNGALTRSFFWDEYRMNRRLFRFPKPYIAIAHALTMGGGVGVSAPARFRVVTEKTIFAMPETGIGLFPDVGATYYLSRCPGRTGIYLALTGARIKAADLLYTGLYTHHVSSEALPDLMIDIENEDPARVIARYATAPMEAGVLAERRVMIDRCFASDTIEGIRAALAAEAGDWARETLATIDRVSPTSLKITLRALQGAARLEFEDCLKVEYRMVRRCMQAHDFFEGVRAALVDKDHHPTWKPAVAGDVTTAMVNSYFVPLTDEDELHFND